MISKEILKKIRQIEIRTSHLVSDVFAGQYHSVFKGQGMEFDEVREYVPGDDIRTIDWNVTARMGHPYIKKYTEERELSVMLLVDISGSQHFGSRAQLKKDLAAELAAVLAYAAIRNNDRVGLVLFTDQVEHAIPLRKGPRHVLRVVRDVLQVKRAHSATRIAAALDYLNHIATRRSVVFLISDFHDQDYRSALRVTARRHDLIAVLTRDRREREWPPVGLVEWQDPETGSRQWVDTSDRFVRHRLAMLATQERDALLSDLRQSGVDTIEVQPGDPYVQALARFFRTRSRRRLE